MERDPEKAEGEGPSDPHQPESIPPWVHGFDPEANPFLTERIYPNSRHYRPEHRPSIIQHPQPQHNHKKGRRWDHVRTADPPLLSAHITKHQQRWVPFMQSGPTPFTQASRVVDRQWVDENMPLQFDADAHEEAEKAAAAEGKPAGLWFFSSWIFTPEGQQRSMELFWRVLLKNPWTPAIFRIVCLAFVCTALGLAGSIFAHIDTEYVPFQDKHCSKRASTWMALIVDSVAVPYIGYVTWDEYFSKPLGLRSATAKVSLLLCDLFFIVFASSNVSLAFDALTDPRWACYDADPDTTNSTCPMNQVICSKQKALSAVMLVAVFFWTVTFSISVMRVVERLRV